MQMNYQHNLVKRKTNFSFWFSYLWKIFWRKKGGQQGHVGHKIGTLCGQSCRRYHTTSTLSGPPSGQTDWLKPTSQSESICPIHEAYIIVREYVSHPWSLYHCQRVYVPAMKPTSLSESICPSHEAHIIVREYMFQPWSLHHSRMMHWTDQPLYHPWESYPLLAAQSENKTILSTSIRISTMGQ